MSDNKNERIADARFIISIEELFPAFDEHISDDSNVRIVFSAKFGMGKTYFLREFFECNKNKYETFHLFPTNYQIATNQDIIEFLKYDLLVDIVNRKNGILKTNDYSSLVDLQRLAYIWGKNNKSKILQTAASYIPKLGKPLQETIVLAEDFSDFKKELEVDEQGLVVAHLEQIKSKNVQEPDALSELIKNKIAELKGSKTSVLVLDDLDRIDPEHIFRLLNIFSAHFDTLADEESNKFGFDKVIVVADVRNIRSIFKHKFGSDADFGGYFDKFYSNEVFYFRNEEIVEKILDKLISNIKVQDKDKLDGALGSSGFLRIILKEILTKSIRLEGREKLNLRQLFSGIKMQLPAFRAGSYRSGMIQTQDKSVTQFINISVQAFISMLGGHKEDLLATLRKIRDNLNESVPENGEDRIYRLLSQYILRIINPYDLNTQNLQLDWKGYTIKVNNGEMTKVQNKTDSSIIHASYLLYDLLIVYVEKDNYLKEVRLY